VISENDREEILEEGTQGSEDSLYLLENKSEKADEQEIKQMMPECLASSELVVNIEEEEKEISVQ
jgi:hypothetical protein